MSATECLVQHIIDTDFHDLSADAAPQSSAGAGDTSYWDVDHSQYGPVTEEPMSRFAQVAAANLAAANAMASPIAVPSSFCN